MSGDLEPSGFRGDQGVFVGVSGSQRAGSVQLGQIIFEHSFNIKGGPDTFRSSGAWGATERRS